MANSSTLEALDILCKSIPDWNTRLDELNGQIAQRQIELAQLEEHERPPTRASMKNKGSTESLRPRDGHENPFLSNDPENADDIQLNPFDTPKSNYNGFARPAVVRHTPPSSDISPKPKPPLENLTRSNTQSTPPTRHSAAIIRKRKTESLASGETQAPKYRTRSMIIVYYDSAVQQAFEELVKFISLSRNNLRKEKMAAKMAKMRRAAELDVEADGDRNDDGGKNKSPSENRSVWPINGSAIKTLSVPKPRIGADTDSTDTDDLPTKLRFVSTRQMGPSRGDPPSARVANGSPAMFRSYRRGIADGAPDIFDDLDKGLEWSQGHCEHAAHQFLRDGECNTEINNIKKKLGEVKDAAEKEMVKLREEIARSPPPTIPEKVSKPTPATESLQVRAPETREIPAAPSNPLEVDDDMEADDSGDDNEPVQLIFKRSRDIVH